MTEIDYIKPMVDRNTIIRSFPELREIKNKRLQRQIVELWLTAVRRGGWKQIDAIPFTLLIKTRRGLVEHTRAVTSMAMAIARSRKDLNLDLVIAGGISHDVGKLLEYTRKGRAIVKSDQGKRIRHPVSGAALAQEIGLPPDVVHIIASHSEEGELVARSKEAVVIHHCDFIDFEIEKSC